jgi:hypothetical protein
MQDFLFYIQKLNVPLPLSKRALLSVQNMISLYVIQTDSKFKIIKLLFNPPPSFCFHELPN